MAVSFSEGGKANKTIVKKSWSRLNYTQKEQQTNAGDDHHHRRSYD